jgi:hypothetical protein
MPPEIVIIAGRQYCKANWSARITGRVIDVVFVMFVVAIFGPVAWLFGIVYLLFGNAFMGGQTLGRRAAGVKVIDSKEGRPCTFFAELLRQRYLFFANPIFLLLSAYDSSQGYFDKPELYVVRTAPPTSTELERPPEKPAKLDLAGMRASIERDLGGRQKVG